MSNPADMCPVVPTVAFDVPTASIEGPDHDQPKDTRGAVRSGVRHLDRLSLSPQFQEYVQERGLREYSTGSTVAYASEELEELVAKTRADRAGRSIVPAEQTKKAAAEEKQNERGASTGKRKRNFTEVAEPARRPRPTKGSQDLPVNDRRPRRKDEELPKGRKGRSDKRLPAGKKRKVGTEKTLTGGPKSIIELLLNTEGRGLRPLGGNRAAAGPLGEMVSKTPLQDLIAAGNGII